MKKQKREEKKYFETKTFNSEYAKWNKILLDTGFQDAETDYDRRHYTGRMNYFDVDPVRLAYHEQCMTWLREGKIEDPTDQFIFEAHCSGVSNREIVILLGQNNELKQLKATAVNDRLLKILGFAGIKPIKLYK